MNIRIVRRMISTAYFFQNRDTHNRDTKITFKENKIIINPKVKKPLIFFFVNKLQVYNQLNYNH